MNNLPQLNQELVDQDTIEALFRDVSACARLLEVIIKGAPAARAQASRPTLEQARTMLLSGVVRGVQLRYFFKDEEWWDTIIRLPSGFRLVRIRQERK